MRSLSSVLCALGSCLLFSTAHAETVQRLSFRDRLYDVAEHAGSLWVVGYPGTLLRSNDGGASFTRVELPVDEALFSIDFNTSGLGAIVGRSGMLLLSEDHGATWSGGIAQAEAGTVAHLFGVEVLENGSLVAVGDFGTVLISQDRGHTWHKKELVVPSESEAFGAIGGSAEQENAGEEARLVAVSFSDDKHGFIAGEFGWVLATEDGGATWKRQASKTDKLLFSIHAQSPRDAIAVGSEGIIIETHDGGQTWGAKPARDARNLFCVSCSGQRCAVSGQEGLVMVRESPEKDFASLNSGALAPLSALSFVNGRDLVVVGNRGYVLRAKQGSKVLARSLGE